MDGKAALGDVFIHFSAGQHYRKVLQILPFSRRPWIVLNHSINRVDQNRVFCWASSSRLGASAAYSRTSTFVLVLRQLSSANRITCYYGSAETPFSLNFVR